MKEIKNAADAAALLEAGTRPDLAALVARKLQDLQDAFDLLGEVYDPDVDGMLVLLRAGAGDDFATVTGLATPEQVRGLCEHVERHDAEGAWEIVVCPSNSWAWTYLVPDEVPMPGGVVAELARQASRQDLVRCQAKLSPF